MEILLLRVRRYKSSLNPDHFSEVEYFAETLVGWGEVGFGRVKVELEVKANGIGRAGLG